MRLYNIVPKKETFEWGEMDVVSLGEKGRGRKLTLVPFHAAYEPDAAEYAIGTTRAGRPKIIRDDAASPGWLALLSGGGVYTRNTAGTVHAYADDFHKFRVHAHGAGAFGAAGRVGGWSDFLVEVFPQYPVRFFVKPAGGRHKKSWYWVIFNSNDSDPIIVDVDESDAFMEHTGIFLPETVMNLRFWEEEVKQA